MTGTFNDIEVDIEEVLRALDIEVLGVRGNWADALCPFHLEHTASFSVSLDNGGWICRHDDSKGNIQQLLIELDQASDHYEATRWLSDFNPREISEDDLIEALLERQPDADKPALIGWMNQYIDAPTDVMCEYWFDRGFDWKDSNRFGVVYDQELRRLLLPVFDIDMNIEGFIARQVPPFRGPKYLYPNGWHRMLYPISHVDTRHSIGANWLAGHIILVEGPFDALLMHKVGYKNTLSMLGADLTKSQEEWIVAHTTRVTLLLDNDTTGRRATRSLARRLGESGIEVSIAILPEYAKDAGDLKDPRREVQNSLANAVSALRLLSQPTGGEDAV